MSNDNHEIDRLTRALHAKQSHPDFDYSVTMEGNEANHHSREGWEPNPEMAEGFNGNADSDQYRKDQPRQLYWMRDKEQDEGMEL